MLAKIVPDCAIWITGFSHLMKGVKGAAVSLLYNINHSEDLKLEQLIT